jgi:hypothetical protein
MGCYLEDYRASVSTWSARTSWPTANGNGRVIFCLGTVVLCARTLAVLLVTGVQNKSGPGVEAENIMQIAWSECDRNLKSGGTQYDTCGRWFHNSCGNVKVHLAKSGKWICDKSRSKRLRLLEEKLQNALF